MSIHIVRITIEASKVVYEDYNNNEHKKMLQIRCWQLSKGERKKEKWEKSFKHSVVSGMKRRFLSLSLPCLVDEKFDSWTMKFNTAALHNNSQSAHLCVSLHSMRRLHNDDNVDIYWFIFMIISSMRSEHLVVNGT